MLKKLTEEQQAELLDKAILEFAEKGYSGAGLSRIAKNAKVSVGVIYKYYEDKEALFRACVGKTLAYLDEVLSNVGAGGATGNDLPALVRALVHQVQVSCKEHPEYFRMYHQITAGNEEQARQLAELIERPSAKAYKAALKKACEEGRIDERLEPGGAAFFFDNLLMMLHYAYSCTYYMQRMDIYCGKRLASSDKKMEEQMVRFILNGLGFKE